MLNRVFVFVCGLYSLWIASLGGVGMVWVVSTLCWVTTHKSRPHPPPSITPNMAENNDDASIATELSAIETELTSIAAQQNVLAQRANEFRQKKRDKYKAKYLEAIASVEPLLREEIVNSKMAHANVDDVVTKCYSLLGEMNQLDVTRVSLKVVEDLKMRYGEDLVKWQTACGGPTAALKPFFEMVERVKQT